MTSRIMLDSGPLGEITHPKAEADVAAWLVSMLEAGCEVVIPEIADYEVRRSLILSGLNKSIERLNELKELLTYAALDTPIMLQAAEHWAEVRKKGKPTADKHALDADVILAAQAKFAGAVVATENVKHLELFVTIKKWSDIGLPTRPKS